MMCGLCGGLPKCDDKIFPRFLQIIDMLNMDSVHNTYKFIFNYYRPKTKFAKVMFSQVSVCPQGGVRGTGGGMHGRGCGVWQGACMVGVCMAEGHVWRGGMHGRGPVWWGHAWPGGMCGRGWQECVWQRGVHGRGVCVTGRCMAGGVCVAGETATAACGTHPTCDLNGSVRGRVSSSR